MYGLSPLELVIVGVLVVFLCRVRFPEVRDRSGRRITILSAEHLDTLIAHRRSTTNELPRGGKLFGAALVGALIALLVHALLPS